MANVAEPLFIHLTISIFQYFNCSIFQSFIRKYLFARLLKNSLFVNNS